MKIEKQPGPDWVVTVEIEGERVAVSVFGAATRAAAELEARRSFLTSDQLIRVLCVRRLSLG
jgi:tRNA(Ser,Leu) C12 N-acetylase TAN1